MVEKDSNKIGDVIRIIDERTLIVNAGNDYLEEGQYIKIYESLDELKDTDGNVIAYFEHTKDKLKVIEVNNSYSICQKQVSKTKSTFDLALSPLLTMGTTEYIPLNVDKDDISPLEPTQPMIKIGDPVKKA